MKERNYNYDIMRVLACIMIILHAPMPNLNANGIILSTISYFTAPGLCLFFVISGSLLLPIKTDTTTFLKKRLGKVIMPTLVFTILYIIVNCINGEQQNILKTICSIPFSAQGHGVLWFMYTLIGLYLVAPVISKWLDSASKREVELYLLLWVITLCFPILKLFVGINEGNTGVLYYFSGYIGYFILGYYLKKYPESISLKKLMIPDIIAIIAPIAFKVMHIEIDFYSMFWYLSIFVALLCTTIYVLISKIKIKKGGIVELISNLSFGIYLIHIAVMRFFIWELDFIININNYILQWIMVVGLTFIISCSIAYVISLLPFGDYIIGYKKQNRK
jgi:surface polysaccharide O-acyltransferase-like enzyme